MSYILFQQHSEIKIKKKEKLPEYFGGDQRQLSKLKGFRLLGARPSRCDGNPIPSLAF